MCVSYVNEHICRVSKFLVTFETFAGGGILESLQLFRICVEHQPLPLFAHLKEKHSFLLKLIVAVMGDFRSCLGENDH